MSEKRSFRVGTYYSPRPGDKAPLRSRISAYTLYYSPEWSGCVEYEIEAETGTQAKRQAIQLRLEHEKGSAA